jgi:HAE1 family hydrophobic/amphiphilic exporter-1
VQDVRDKVSAALNELPPDLEPPVVSKLDLGAAPIMVVAVSGELPIRELTRIADDLVKQNLQTLSGVGDVELVGGREREFHVWIDPQRLEARGLAVGEVIGALGAQNVEIPGGRLDVGSQELMVKTRGQVHSAQELGQITITALGGLPVRIGDVARVEDGEEEGRSYSALDGEAAVSLVVRKQSGANTVKVAQLVRQRVEQLERRIPAGARLAIPLDNSTYIEHAIGDVQFDLAFGAMLAVIIILFSARCSP